MISTIATELVERLRTVRLLCLDVDGVLTDGHLYWCEAGGFAQRFYVQDGFGIKLLQRAGIEVAILSGGDIRSARARAESLGIRHAYFGLADKMAAYEALSRALGIGPEDTAFVGDELIDVPLLAHVRFGATVPEAVDGVKRMARYVTRRPGGQGAVREICDLVLACSLHASAIPFGGGMPAAGEGQPLAAAPALVQPLGSSVTPEERK